MRAEREMASKEALGCYTAKVHGRKIAIVRAGAFLAMLGPIAGLPSEPIGEKVSPAGWALRPVTRPATPIVRNQDWVRTPIDAFILEALKRNTLEPSPVAEKGVLLRRATFDLHGLPPTPAELDDFSSDDSPEAFAKVVDRLLASPRYGERWARHWLDVVRFAESHGFEFDRLRENAWRYRDYVIQSLNADKPYDQFVREQLAGDVLSPPRREGIVATGFLVAGPWDEAGYTSASALLKERIREDELEDMIAAVGQTFLGFTVNCARCHDHKFDPIPQRDYYRMKAALQGVRHGERSALPPEEAKARQEYVDQLQQNIADLEKRLAGLEGTGRRLALERRPKSLAGPSPIARWTFETDTKDVIAGIPATLHGEARIADGRLKLDGKKSFAQSALLSREIREKTLEGWVTLANLEQRGGSVVSIEADKVFDAIVFGEREPGKWMVGSSYFQRTRSLGADSEAAGPTELIHVAITYDSSNRITFYRNGAPHGKSYVPEGENAALQTFGSTNAHLLFGLRHTGSKDGRLAGEIEEVRLYDRALTSEEIRSSFQNGPILVSEEEIALALNPDENRARVTLRAELKQRRAELQRIPQVTKVYAANPNDPGPTFVLNRGDVEKRKEPVVAGGLSAITNLNADFGLEADAAEGQRRLRLAEWMTDPRNPLTARVMVNRIWHYHLGHGLAGLPNDFGVNGEYPSHPGLLDWLAAEFVEHGWSIKHLHRLIMLSSVYQQGSAPRKESAARAKNIDADNRLLWKFPLRRLEAETVRDSLLSVSGEIDLKLGGPSYRPFDVTVSGSNFYEPRDDPKFLRRTIYRMGVHSGKDALLDSLDCPDPSTKTPARAVTTTPIQSLGLMNNPFVLRQSRVFAERLRRETGTDVGRQVNLAYRLAFGRPPTVDEARGATELANEHGLDSVAWALVNASEFVYVR
jgi:hypothetical protein